jgi:SAM-dependent methyltransferase
LNTTSLITSSRTILYCPACKEKLEQTGNCYICKSCNNSFPILDNIPSLIVHHAAIDSFDASEFESLFQMEQKHFWHVGRREIILDIIERNVPDPARTRMFEIGCGNGSVLAFLKKNGIEVEGGDIFREGLVFCRQRVGSVPLYQIDVLDLPFQNQFEIIGLFDVLEHIDNDNRALTEIRKALKRRGMLLITVPAYQFLWSYFDVGSNHKRRYRRTELIRKLEQAGFTVKKASYFMFFLFPLLAMIRLLGNIGQRKDRNQMRIDASIETKTVPVLNEIFLGFLRLEKFLLHHFNLPFGASLIVLAEK